MKPGMIIKDIEGYDLGPEGAVIVKVDGEEVELARLDTKEFLTIQLGDLDYTAEEAVQGEGFTAWGYDEDAMESPDLHVIRTLPNWWGPRDPNSPSSLTDVSYRPEPTWRRQQHRHYSLKEDIRMTHRRNQRYRTAEPLQQMDPVPRSTAQPQQLQRDYGLPRRMRLDRWAETHGDVFDTEVLVAHTLDFWKQYRTKRYAMLAESSSHKSLNLKNWGLIYMDRVGLVRPEIELLYRFMSATDIIPENEFLEFQDVLDTYSVFRYNRVSG